MRAFFVKWIAKWPTVQDLATATEDDVRAIWAGLGYYRRCGVAVQLCNLVVLTFSTCNVLGALTCALACCCSCDACACRAAFLLKGAQHVVDNLGGKLPGTAAQLAKIPGIGPYTSAAIASIAFGEPAAAVDGNVMRVMARLLTLPGNPKEKTFVSAVTLAATNTIDTARPGDFNQAVMELGATRLIRL